MATRVTFDWQGMSERQYNKGIENKAYVPKNSSEASEANGGKRGSAVSSARQAASKVWDSVSRISEPNTPLLNVYKASADTNALADVLTQNEKDERDILGYSPYTGDPEDIARDMWRQYGVDNAADYRHVSNALADSLLSGTVDAARNTVNFVGYSAQTIPKDAYVNDRMNELSFGSEAANREADRLYEEYRRENPNGEATREKLFENAVRAEYEEKFGKTELRDIASFGKKYSEDTQEAVSELNEAAQKDAQFYRTVGNMLPYITVSAVTGGVGAATGIKAITTAGKILSSSQMYLSAAGQAAEQAFKNGASAEDAVRYGNAVGAIELGTEAMFSGLGKAVGGVFGDVGLVNKVLERAQKSMGAGTYTAVNYIVSTVGEGFEELVSEFGDYAAARIIDEGIDPRTVSEVKADALEAFTSGALLSFFMQTASLMSQGVPAEEAVQQSVDQYIEENRETIRDLADKSYAKRATRILNDEALLREYTETYGAPTGSKTQQAETIAKTLYQADHRRTHPVTEESWYQGNTDSSYVPEAADNSPRFTGTQSYVRGLLMEHTPRSANEIIQNREYRAAFEQLTGQSLDGMSTNKAKALILGIDPNTITVPDNPPGWYDASESTREYNPLADTLVGETQSTDGTPLADTLTNRGNLGGYQYSFVPNGRTGEYEFTVQTPDGREITGTSFNPMDDINEIATRDRLTDASGSVPQTNGSENPNSSFAENPSQTGETAPSVPENRTPMRETPNTGNMKDSQTGWSVRNAAVTPDEVRAAIDKGRENNEWNTRYFTITNDATTAAATQEIVEKGWEKARQDWHDAVIQGKAGDQMTAMGAILYNNAVSAGNMQEAMDIFSDLNMLGKTTGRGLQAFRILKNLSPDSRLYMINRSISNMKSRGRLSSDFRFSDEALNEYAQAKTDKARDAAVARMQKEVGNAMTSSFLDRWTALRYLNMLGNFKTQERNIVGNVAMLLNSTVKYDLQTVIEFAANKASGGRVKRTTALVGGKYLKAGMKDAKTFMDIIQNGGRYNDQVYTDEFQRGAVENKTVFRFKPLEMYRKATNWMTENGDVIFNVVVYGRSVAGYLKANGMDANTYSEIVNGTRTPSAEEAALLDDARVFAIKEAQDATFHDNNAFSDWVTKIGRRADTPKWARAIVEGTLPFRRTPANVAARAEEYSPLGLINTAVNAVKAAKGTATANDVINSLSKTLTGSGMIALGFALRNLGVLRGGEDDDDKKWFDTMNGRQEYALVLPNGDTYTIDWAAPTSILLFFGSQVADIAASEEGFSWKNMEEIVTDMSEPFIQMSMLQGIDDTLNDIKYSDNNLLQLAANAFVSYMTQGITNTFAGQIARSLEDERMTYYVDPESDVPDWIQKAAGKTILKIPNVFGLLDNARDTFTTAYIDAWGRRADSGSLMENTISPGYIGEDRVTEVEEELYRLNDSTYDSTGVNVFPRQTFSSQKVTVYNDDGGTESRYLSKEEFTRYAEVRGQTSLDLVSRLLGSEGYRYMGDIEKAEAIENIYNYAAHKAAAAVESTTKEDKLDGLKSDDIVRYYTVSGLTDSMNDRTRDFDAIERGIELYSSASDEVKKLFGSDMEKLSDAKKAKVGMKEYFAVKDGTEDTTNAAFARSVRRNARNKVYFMRSRMTDNMRVGFDKAVKIYPIDDIIDAYIAKNEKRDLTEVQKTIVNMIY